MASKTQQAAPGEDQVNVLLVDDQPARLMSYDAILSVLGHNLVHARSGTEALARLMEGDYAAILLDINMPGMDGYELARRLREMDPEHPPVLATVTAYSDVGHLDRAADAGFDLHFTKPADPAEVIEQLDDCVGR